MGLRRALKKLWRIFHPQWTAMTKKEIEDLDRAVSNSMAKGTFTQKQDPQPEPHMTGDRLWSLHTTVHPTVDHPHYFRGGGVGGDDRHMSLSSQRTRASRVSAASSYAYDSGYGDQYYPGSSVSGHSRGHQQYYNNSSSSNSRTNYYHYQPQQQQQQHRQYQYQHQQYHNEQFQQPYYPQQHQPQPVAEEYHVGMSGQPIVA